MPNDERFPKKCYTDPLKTVCAVHQAYCKKMFEGPLRLCFSSPERRVKFNCQGQPGCHMFVVRGNVIWERQIILCQIYLRLTSTFVQNCAEYNYPISVRLLFGNTFAIGKRLLASNVNVQIISEEDAQQFIAFPNRNGSTKWHFTPYKIVLFYSFQHRPYK